jgi:hypothetical protein
MDWETKVLRRMERRIESLTAPDSPEPRSLPELGWEEASLLALERRVKTMKVD